MSALDSQKISRLKRGERVGFIATILSGAVLAYFIVGFSVSWVNKMDALQTAVWATAPALEVIFVALAAYCNLKYGRGIEREIHGYVESVFIENAASMHPERNSLSFFVEIGEDGATVSVNDYKDRINFDFSALGRLTASRKITISNQITDKIVACFCRLYERGGEYKSVNYMMRDSKRKKSYKPVPIIVDGKPDVKTFKRYLKNK